jgi:hypothetical protein
MGPDIGPILGLGQAQPGAATPPLLYVSLQASMAELPEGDDQFSILLTSDFDPSIRGQPVEEVTDTVLVKVCDLVTQENLDTALPRLEENVVEGLAQDGLELLRRGGRRRSPDLVSEGRQRSLDGRH